MADERVGGFGVWYGVTAGIVFWAAHVSGMAVITPFVCHSGQYVWYHVLSIATLAPTLAAFLPSWQAWRSDAGLGGLRFLGGMGLLVTAVSALAILAEWVPVFVLDACAS